MRRCPQGLSELTRKGCLTRLAKGQIRCLIFMKTKEKKEVKKTESEDGADTATEEEGETDVVEETEEESTDEHADDKKDDKKEDDESDDKESEEDESADEEDDSESSSKKEDELDLDAELEKERAAGKPDVRKAGESFKDRKNKREGTGADKPLTQADLDAVEARIRKEQQNERALELAKEMAGSDKEAELIVAKWANRTFPKSLTLREQMQEAYAITHSKKLIGERNEALRALKGKRTVRNDSAGAHREGDKNPNEPKLPPADVAAIRAAGFSFNNTTRQYEKKLPNGRLLVRDPKTKQVRLLPKKR